MAAMPPKKQQTLNAVSPPRAGIAYPRAVLWTGT